MKQTPRLKETLPVRLQTSVFHRLLIISEKAGITKSDALRMAVNHGLPLLESGRIALRPAFDGEAGE